MDLFADKLISWYLKCGRDLPWRKTSDAYLIWLSEVILQQTRVDQGLSYYNKFAAEFPSVTDLAAAEEETVLKLWQGLGYYSRARNLRAAAQQVKQEYNGKFPSTYSEIIKLKGVGEYTAAAVASFAFNERRAVVDGNVYRVLSRIFGIETPIDSTKGKKEFSQLANELIHAKKPGTYNQAIMEFGAMHCKPRNPDCGSCIFNSICVANEKSMVDSLPVKSKKTKVRNRYFNYLVLNHKGKVLLNKRVSNDIWKNLYDFPLIETVNELSEEEFILSQELKERTGSAKLTIRSVSSTYKHILSHQRIYARFWEIDLAKPYSLHEENTVEVSEPSFEIYAVPRLVENYLLDRRKHIVKA